MRECLGQREVTGEIIAPVALVKGGGDLLGLAVEPLSQLPGIVDALLIIKREQFGNRLTRLGVRLSTCSRFMHASTPARSPREAALFFSPSTLVSSSRVWVRLTNSFR